MYCTYELQVSSVHGKNYNFCLKVFRHPLQRYAAAQTVYENLMAIFLKNQLFPKSFSYD